MKMARPVWFFTVTVLIAVLTLGVAPNPASAVVYPLDYVFSPPTGAVAPLGYVTLTDVRDSVWFEVTNQAGAGSKLDSFYFNFD